MLGAKSHPKYTFMKFSGAKVLAPGVKGANVVLRVLTCWHLVLRLGTINFCKIHRRQYCPAKPAKLLLKTT